MKSFLVQKFTCTSCSSSYIGKTCHHFKTRIEEHIKADNKSHIFKHLHSTTRCSDLHNSLSFKIIDKASSKFNLKIKEASHINWKKPTLNTQQNHLALIVHPFTIACVTPFFFSLFVFFFSHFFFAIIFIASETPIISIFYCLNYSSLLLHLIINNLVNTFYNNYVFNICPMQLLWFMYISLILS